VRITAAKHVILQQSTAAERTESLRYHLFANGPIQILPPCKTIMLQITRVRTIDIPILPSQHVFVVYRLKKDNADATEEPIMSPVANTPIDLGNPAVDAFSTGEYSSFLL
jgi:hypothetical protein